jgi:hypothetical protein
MPPPEQFVHRFSERLYYSICRKCIQTAGKAKQEKDLAVAEESHVCDLFHLEMIQTFMMKKSIG